MTALSGSPGRWSAASRGGRPDRSGRGGRDSPRGRGRSAGPADSDLGADPDTDVQPPGSSEDDPGDPESVARSICLRALTGAPKTRSQLADLLARKGYGGGLAAAVVREVLDAAGAEHDEREYEPL
jgi:regulatory protein